MTSSGFNRHLAHAQYTDIAGGTLIYNKLDEQFNSTKLVVDHLV